MKEFLLGGLLAIWIVILGLCTLHPFVAILTIVYPLMLALLAFTYDYLKRELKRQKRKLKRRLRLKPAYRELLLK
jgi:membrane protein implicated in regulation of membrane protease activity